MIIQLIISLNQLFSQIILTIIQLQSVINYFSLQYAIYLYLWVNIDTMLICHPVIFVQTPSFMSLERKWGFTEHCSHETELPLSVCNHVQTVKILQQEKKFNKDLSLSRRKEKEGFQRERCRMFALFFSMSLIYLFLLKSKLITAQTDIFSLQSVVDRFNLFHLKSLSLSAQRLKKQPTKPA